MDPADRPVGWVLVPTLYVCAAGILASGVAATVLTPSLSLVLVFAPLLSSLAVSFVAAWQGRVQLASHVYLFTLAAVVFGSGLLSNGIHSQAFLAFPTLLVLASVLLSRRSVVVFALAQAAVGAVYFYFEDTIATWALLPTDSMLQYVTFAMSTVFISGVVFVVVDRFRRQLLRSEASREQLGEAFTQLERTSVTRGHLDDVVRAVRDMVLVTDAQRTIVQANPAAYDGLGLSEELLGRPLETLFREPSLLDFGERSRKLEVLRSDGLPLPVLVSRGQLTETSGEVWVLTDISVQEAAVESIRRSHARADSANQAKSQFLANMSHELRTPLNAIIGYSELVSEEVENEAHLADLDRIRVSGEHLLGLINGILDLSKVEAGKMVLELAEVDLQTVVRRVADTVRPRILARGLELEVTTEGLDLPVRIDEQKLTQVLLNLLSNASKFTEQGTIRFKAEGWSRQGLPWVRLTVADTGLGMSEAQLDTVFEPFVQAHSDVVHGGTGLGLSISRAFVWMMGGEIHVDSRVARGTTFTVEIPVGELASLDDPPSDQGVPVERIEGVHRVAHLSGEPATSSLVARALDGPHLQVVGTTDSIRGLAWIRANPPDLVLLDVIMPRFSGWAVLTEIRQQFSQAELPVVMLGAEGDLGVARVLGANALLQKPIDREALLAVVESHLANR